MAFETGWAEPGDAAFSILCQRIQHLFTHPRR
jgi:hypothetical protein